MRGTIVLLFMVASLAGCIADEGRLDAPSGVDGPDGAARSVRPVLEPHEEPVRDEGEVVVERQGDRYKATRTVTVTNGVGVDTRKLAITQQTTNGGMGAYARPDGDYEMVAKLYAYGDTEQQARDSLASVDVRHTDTLAGDTLTLDTRVILRQSGSLPVSLPDVGSDRGGSLTLRVPTGLASTIRQAGVNGGAAIGGLMGPSATVDTTNGGITVEGAFDDLDLTCTNGGIDVEAGRYSEGAGTWDIDCTNGGLDIRVVSGDDRGFDVTADITNGGIDIDLPDVEEVGQQSARNQHVRTVDYADRAFRTAIDLDGTNGGIHVTD